MKKILIIEDDRILRENTVEFLRGENFEVFVATDGLEGIQQTLQNIPDIILCDISMPNMNGYDFYKTIKQIKATSTIPLVFFSARTENQDIRAGMQLGADDYVIKPFDFFELLKVIKTRLAKHNTIEKFYDEKFYALVKHPTLGMFIFQNGKFIYYNETLSEIFGYSKADFSNIPFKELIEKDATSQLKVLNDIDRCIKDTANSISINFLALHKNSSKIKVEFVGTVINYKGVPSIVGNIIRINEKQNNAMLKPNKDTDFKLSKREMEVLKLICKGKSTSEIAEHLFLSQRTIESHRSKLLSKTNFKNSAELIIHALRQGIVTI
jgi:PAS domain S-box-containing protein